MSWPPKLPNLEAIATADGSWTLRDLDLDETYHSRHGAIQESRHVFLQASDVSQRAERGQAADILEIGFGTGLNFCLTAECFRSRSCTLNYTAYEIALPPVNFIDAMVQAPAFPAHLREVWQETWRRLQYGQTTIGLFGNIHLTIILQAADSAILPDSAFDVVYLDAFSPEKAPELWTPHFLAALAKALRPGGVLVSYCAKGKFRRGLQQAGLTVEKLPGPPGKRHMTRATKI